MTFVNGIESEINSTRREHSVQSVDSDSLVVRDISAHMHYATKLSAGTYCSIFTNHLFKSSKLTLIV